jgi:hypothetical protein
MSKIKVGFLFLMLLLVACNQPPKGVLSESRMENVLVEVHLLEGTFDANAYPQDSELKKYYYKYVLDKQKVSVASFDSSIHWYLKHPDVYERIYTKVEKRLNQKKADLEKDSLKIVSKK